MSNADGSTCSTPQRSCSGEDSDSDYENENIRPRGLTGLQNLGNTCYLNSALQSLSNCPPLTRYFLDCARLIRPEKPPMLARSYLKLITELWHKKRPSYVVPSGVVTGIKAVHPMFRGYTQQDAQEFLRCLMDQLHEELKAPYSDDSDDDDVSGENDDDSNNAIGAEDISPDQKVSHCVNRRPSFDSLSSQSELDYETCDSGLSSERSSSGERDNGSSDENNSDGNEVSKLRQPERIRKSSTASSPVPESTDSVANTKEMKETANLLEKKNESETQGRRPVRSRAGMEGGDAREQGSTASCLSAKESEGHTSVIQPLVASMHPQSTQQQQPQSVPVAPASKATKPRKVKNIKYDSIISQTFDGKILSSVRCLNCETVSTTKETFQDLSLPIPSKDHLHMLHSGHPLAGGVNPPKGGTCGEVHQGWLAWMFSWMKSWFIGPIITLQDCLSAFFSADELKGDNMYSCDKCKKLRNGLKYSKVLDLPEILSIHLKRFRHEFYSSKISTYISFPMEGLDMEPYLHKACQDEVTLYDLIAIICHHGTAGGGHYTAYCLNHLNEQWYEFDDQYVTEVDISQVQNCEAYVLFYRKSNRKMESLRQRMIELERSEPSILRFYLSKQWESRFYTFAEPGLITNKDFLCKHGGVPPGKVNLIDDLVVEINQSTWELLYNRFGGGPVCNHLYVCKTCQYELEKLRQRQLSEKDHFIQLNEEFQAEEHTAAVYAISMAWFKEWEAFVREKTDIPPGPVENNRIVVYKNGQPTLRQASDYGQLSKDMWLFLHRIYGGGPELIIRQSLGASVKPVSSSPTPQQNSTLKGLPSATCTSSLSSAASASVLTSSNTSAVSSHSYMQQSSVTSSEMASQTMSCPTYQSNSSSYPVPLYAPTASTDACDRTVEPEGCNLASQQPAIADAPSVANKTNVGKEVPSVNQIPTSPIKQSHEVQQSKENEVSTSVVPKQELSLPQDGQHSGLSKQDKQKTLSKSMDDVSRQTSPSKSVKIHEHGDASSNKHPQQASINQSPMKGKCSSLTSFIPVPASCSSLSQLQTNSSFTKMASVSSDQVITFSSQSEIPSGCQLSDEETPSPLTREDLKTSIESLPDSGVGTDYSCSGTDIPSLPGILAKLQSGNEHSCEYNIDSAAAVKENNPSNVQSLTVSKEATAVVSQRKIETKAILSPVPSNTNHAKAKKKNKKGKNMDVTRV
ncbi:hypothetical protein BsWGS_23508 [Bradybaena similaris]